MIDLREAIVNFHFGYLKVSDSYIDKEDIYKSRNKNLLISYIIYVVLTSLIIFNPKAHVLTPPFELWLGHFIILGVQPICVTIIKLMCSKNKIYNYYAKQYLTKISIIIFVLELCNLILINILYK